MTQKTSFFWGSKLGIFLRWILFIPSGMLIISIIDIIVMYSFTLLLAFSETSKMISLLLLGIISTTFIGLIYGAGAFAGWIAPHKKIGAIILTVILLYGAYSDIYTFYLTDSTGSMPKWLYLSLKSLIFVLFVSGIWAHNKK